ncbi:MAG: hypothetical protein WD534_10905 [Phycisphaeraceae bacterium]
MKMTFHLTAWAFVALIVLYASVHPTHGVLYHNPLACLGVGLIGLGLCVQARQAVRLRA